MRAFRITPLRGALAGIALPFVVLVVLSLLFGCAPVPFPLPTTVDTSCAWVHVIKPNDEDHLSDRTARAILALDEAITSNCPGAAR